MAIGIEWLKNKNKSRFYPVSHAVATLRGDSNVDADLSAIEAAHENLDKRLSDLDSEFHESDMPTINAHISTGIYSETGVHGVRYQDDVLQVYDGSTWVNIEVGSHGSTPADMKFVFVGAGVDANSLTLRGVDPDDTVVDGTVVSKWAGTKIVRKVGSYPTRVSDGTLVVDYQTRNQYSEEGFMDTGLVEGQTYYYRWFPYSDQGAVNINPDESANRASYTTKAPITLGVMADWANNLYSRSGAAIGLNPGEDFNQFDMYGKRSRCIVADDGTILAYYGEDAYTETGRLTKEVVTNNKRYEVGTSCQVMVYQPKFYYKVEPSAAVDNAYGTGKAITKAIYHIADAKYSGFKIHPAFVRDGREVPYILISAFECCPQQADGTYLYDNEGLGNRLGSIAGAIPATGGNSTTSHTFTRQSARTLASARGEGWSLSDALAVSCTQLLFLIEYATMDSQAAIGAGNVNGSASIQSVSRTGMTSSLGNGSGSQGLAVSYRGEENLWGNVWTWIDGINIYNNNTGIAFIADHGFVNAVTADPYRSTGFNFARGTAFVSAFGYSDECDYMFIASETKGNSSSPVGDQFSSDYTNGNITVASLGGHCGSQTSAGLFCWYFSDQASVSSELIGSRLMFVPSV